MIKEIVGNKFIDSDNKERFLFELFAQDLEQKTYEEIISEITLLKKDLNLLKLKETDIVKIVDFLPQDSIELNKIVNESNLDQEEISKILSILKN